MKKMMLDLDALAVESFEIDAPEGRGTVVGAAKPPAGSEIDACPSAWHCTIDPQLCGNTLDKSCGGTCDLNTGCGCSGFIC
ncbi:MAG TPA: hypothetical protein VM890_16150 [Longimicrobium sp.]|jgi:hypothetical protein|nr:hypothetical protein [Longimicrobium sp.]